MTRRTYCHGRLWNRMNSTAQSSPQSPLIYRVCLLSLVVLAILSALAFLRIPGVVGWTWLMPAFLALAVTTTLAGETRRLPLQNILTVAGLIFFISGLAHFISARTGIPFGSFFYTENMGPRILGTLPIAIPFIWIVGLLSSRGVARLILRPWRKMRAYGFWLIGITALLIVILDLSLEPFASRTFRYWIWTMPDKSLDWFGAPWFSFIGWFLIAILILAFATPWLIQKKPGKTPPPDYHPLVIWLLLQSLMLISNGVNQFWVATIAGALLSVVVTSFAIRGASW